MFGVVSLLDEENSSFIRSLWEGLSREFGFGGMAADSSPHISFHVAERYDATRVEDRVRSLARSVPPFKTKTTGIGIFQGPEHVVVLPVVRLPRLTVVHRAICDELAELCSDSSELYAPDSWMPHVTLGRWDTTANNTGDIVRWLATRELDRDLPLTNLALLEEGGETRRVLFVHKLAS